MKQLLFWLLFVICSVGDVHLENISNCRLVSECMFLCSNWSFFWISVFLCLSLSLSLSLSLLFSKSIFFLIFKWIFVSVTEQSQLDTKQTSAFLHALPSLFVYLQCPDDNVPTPPPKPEGLFTQLLYLN